MVLERSTSDSYVSNIDDMKISSTDEVTLLEVLIDNKLTSKSHINDLCRKALYKIHALRGINPFLIKRKSQVPCECF